MATNEEPSVLSATPASDVNVVNVVDVRKAAPKFKKDETAPTFEEIRAETNAINAKQIGATLKSTYVNPDDEAYTPA